MGRVARELVVDVPSRRKRAALDAVRAAGVMGVQVRDRTTGAPPGRVHVVAWLPPTDVTVAIAHALEAQLGAGCTVSWTDVSVTWEEAEPPRPLGRRFVVVGAAEEAPADRMPLVLDGALAFGDGLHPTTALCVEALESSGAGLSAAVDRRALPSREARQAGVKARAARRREQEHTASSARGAPSVLDVGTGTGVLAIVAARLGARPVVAQDVDPLAVFAARQAVAANGVDVDVREALPDGTFDLVVANLYLEPLLALLPALLARCEPGGALLVSGFVDSAVPTVSARLAEAGGTVVEGWRRDGWAALLARRG